jgi:hypothetical protein
MELNAGLRTYKCTYTFSEVNGQIYAKYISAESEEQAGELFDEWADNLPEWPQLIRLEEAA